EDQGDKDDDVYHYRFSFRLPRFFNRHDVGGKPRGLLRDLWLRAASERERVRAVNTRRFPLKYEYSIGPFARTCLTSVNPVLSNINLSAGPLGRSANVSTPANPLFGFSSIRHIMHSFRRRVLTSATRNVRQTSLILASAPKGSRRCCSM